MQNLAPSTIVWRQCSEFRIYTTADFDFVFFQPPQKRCCPCHKMSMFVLDISKAISDNSVEWLQFFSNNSLETPEVAILYSLVAGRGELIMFGGLQKDVAMMRNQAAANENDSVTNALYFLTPPQEIV